MRTHVEKPADAQATRKWWVVDAKGQPLGRLASRVASLLSGKHKPTYTPHVDTGDFVIVVNASQVKLSGNKATTEALLPSHRLPGRDLLQDLRRPRWRTSRTFRSRRPSRACCPRVCSDAT